MTLRLSDDLALAAVAAARYEADGTDDALLCLRLEVESVWRRVSTETQAAYDRYRKQAREEHMAAIEADLEAFEAERERARKLEVVR